MRKMLNKKSGFTLIELMIVVAILGILAAIAIPAFVTYVRRSKTVEATENIDKMFSAVSSYYDPADRAGRGVAASQFVHCVVAAATDGKTPNDTKQTGLWNAAGTPWLTTNNGIGFMVEYAYYNYQIASPGAACNGLPNQAAVYTLFAVGDLDNDGTRSTFEQAVGSNAENELYRARGFYVINETE